MTFMLVTAKVIFQTCRFWATPFRRILVAPSGVAKKRRGGTVQKFAGLENRFLKVVFQCVGP